MGSILVEFAVVPKEFAGANINRALAKITPAEDVTPTWLAYALETPWLQEWMDRGSRGVARNILNLSLIAQAPIPLAPVAEMAWLVRLIEARRAGLRALRQQLSEAISASSTFAANVQVRAFDGQLSLQDPDDHLVAMAAIERLETTRRPERARTGRRKIVNQPSLREVIALPPSEIWSLCLKDTSRVWIRYAC